jgi:hypothetical protein
MLQETLVEQAEMPTPDESNTDPIHDENIATIVHEVRDRMERYGISLHDLITAVNGTRRVFSILMRDGLGIEDLPWTLSESERQEAVEKMAGWVKGVDDEDDLITQVERRMAGVHTISSLAKNLQIDAANLSMVLTRRNGLERDWYYTKPKILQALTTWLDDADAHEDPLGLAETPTFKALQSYYGLAISAKSIVSIIGEVGIGKSHAAMHYYRKNPKTWRAPGVVYVRFVKGDTTENAILWRITQALYNQGLIPTTSGYPLTIILDTLGQDDLLLLDEVHFTTDKGSRAIEVFHSLYNELPMPIVLQGNNDLKGTLWDNKKQTFAGLANRSYRIPAMQTTKEDVSAWMQWAGHEDKSLIRAAQEIAARPGQSGGLRTLVLIITAFEKLNPGVKLTAKSINATKIICGKA